MLHHRTECPHCGNEITVNNAKKIQKCIWCKRLVSVNFERKGKKKKFKCEVEPMYFEKKNYNAWEDNDIYGM